MTRLGKPTGPKPGFSRADVVEAALALGVADFTLTAVAGRLGVAVSGLYRTIDSREDLLAACLERIAAQADFAHPGTTWQDEIRAGAESMWDLLEQHPGLAGVLIGVPWAHQLFADLFAEAHQTLVDRGLVPEDAGIVLDFVGDTVITMHAQIEVMRSPIDQAAPSPGAAGERGGDDQERQANRANRPTGLEEASRFASTRTRPMPAVLTPEAAVALGDVDAVAGSGAALYPQIGEGRRSLAPVSGDACAQVRIAMARLAHAGPDATLSAEPLYLRHADVQVSSARKRVR